MPTMLSEILFKSVPLLQAYLEDRVRETLRFSGRSSKT